MALARGATSSFSPTEIEFLAEDEPITIVPSQKLAQLDMISGTYGPFRPPMKTKVPLWLAVTLKKKQKCNIQPPEWLDADRLQDLSKRERDEGSFSALPFHFMEIAQLLLDCASDDIPRAELVKTLLKDLREIRQSKAHQGLKQLGYDYLQMDNLGLMEINEIRPFFTKVFNQLRRLNAGDNAMEA
ncbi:hypothetical protein SmJEL517_g03278 [Synchytrium microbalum]|uniref:DNA replication complex GINS protein PSF2 n=1 Tax=Synchytrium microbalum TaxID=1806994 RepID=A0A507BZ48_9FUNG|nr:uncharacterized protein SmJEL517_g03278 [Synchytrium microbalum]TPX34077.1 hypothetical protein SmJEL517_g03278 [Synchytrium microbalum]